ncbi:tripartite tricarboxylate transporter substrate binding protein [Opitutia bacterium ISCC 51]|nr:tripartite tricarboxylate transporter substrate binding protein [Opitutae bacterium ISCC 51]QXD27576.1 tripartite tricarboxylate transporter substrate binding protein [Opitutae bacterium ISCC 52]
MRILSRLALLSAFSLSVLTSLTAAFPEKPIKVILPTNAGGETDGLVRLLQRGIAEKQLLSEKMVIVNLPGAGGTLGTRKIKQAKPDGYTIGLWHSGIVTSKAMGIVDFDHNDFELICMSGYTELLLGVTEKSQFKSIEGLLDVARAEPRSVKVSTNIGLPVHLIPLLFAEEAGVEFRFIQSGGGAPRLTSLLGGHSDMTMLSTMAFINFRESGLKPLVTFSGERDPLFPNVPTAKEIGVDVELVEIRVWLAPKGTPEPILNTIRTAIQTVMQDPEISGEMKKLGVVPKFGGEEVAQPMLDVLLQKVAPLVGKARNMGP